MASTLPAQSVDASGTRGIPLVFVHLSDIHFRKPKVSIKYELDADLRNELQRDAKHMAGTLGQPDATLVTGDVAFSGSVEEYKIAADWLLGDLSAATGCLGENVCTIPGNHDVDRNVIRRARSIRDCHRIIRGEQLHLLDSTIQEYVGDPIAFYAKIENYNAFAAPLRCDVTVADPCWSRNFGLNDGSVLRLWGANSTLISDESDDLRTGRTLALGSHQCTMKNEDGVEYMFLCHHPPQWLIDQDEVEKKIVRARVQLFGHKHQQRLNQIDGHLRVAAGAVQPDRQERDWTPRYNWLRLAVAGEADARVLVIDVFPRVYSAESQQFEADYQTCQGKESRQFTLPIASWSRPAPVDVAMPPPPRVESGRPPVNDETTSRPAPMDPARTLAYRFLTLPFVRRMAVAQALQLLRDEDESVTDVERSRRIFSRAQEGRQLGPLWDEVERLHGDGKYPINPFSK